MGISRNIKDIILITIWLILLFIVSIFIVISHLFVLFIGGLIFIYEEIKGKIHGKRR
tara:strand:- start:546 stop:716 length:171 start_codon:yes stop_codon:yes gene_type:complete